MKVLDIITEGVVEHVFKWTFRDAAKRAIAENLVERVASDIFEKFTVPALKNKTKGATTKDVQLAVEEAVAGTKYAGDKEFAKEVVEQVKKYHNTELVPVLRKAKPGKKTDPSDVKKRAADSRTKLALLGVNGLIAKLCWMYAAYDVIKSVTLYFERIDWALQRLELGEDGKDADGDPGISLETFEIYHREQLGQLFLSIATVHPALFTKIPIFGWLAKPFTALGGSGAALWQYFTNADPSMYGILPLPGQEPDENLREMIARYAMWQIADIPWLPGTSGESLASILGVPIKWTTDFVQQLWTSTVQEVYGDKIVPEILQPTLLPDHPSNTKPQGAAVTPGDADQNSGTSAKPPYAKGDAYYHKSDWQDIGGGYERHKFNGTVAKKLPRGNLAKDVVQNGPQRNPADWRDIGNGYEVNIKTKPNGESIPFVTGVIQLKN
jgi:hypothetical protein